MLRQLHSIPGLIAAALLIVVTLTGAALSIQPALERAAVAGAPPAPRDGRRLPRRARAAPRTAGARVRASRRRGQGVAPRG